MDQSFEIALSFDTAFDPVTWLLPEHRHALATAILAGRSIRDTPFHRGRLDGFLVRVRAAIESAMGDLATCTITSSVTPVCFLNVHLDVGKVVGLFWSVATPEMMGTRAFADQLADNARTERFALVEAITRYDNDLHTQGGFTTREEAMAALAKPYSFDLQAREASIVEEDFRFIVRIEYDNGCASYFGPGAKLLGRDMKGLRCTPAECRFTVPRH